MIRSMTGFGAASADHAGVHHAVELRSVNNRYFKPRLRLPDALSALEADLEKRLRQHIHRGSVTLTVQVRDQTAEAAHEVNEPAMLAYLEHLETIRSRLDADQPVQIDLTALMNLPGVLQPVADHGQRAEQSAEIVHDLVEQACEQLTTMRRREGKALGEELTGFGREIAERLEIIQKRAPEVARAYHQRLQDRVQELIRDAEVDIAGPELAREVAVFAERADIREELQRLQGHLDQFHQRLDDDSAEPVGRTLEFLAQEMLREANTLGSKASDTEIGREVVTIKGVIDRIREQAANVE